MASQERPTLDRHPVHQTSEPATSTWGHAGYLDTWLSGKVDWIYNHLTECAERMEQLAIANAWRERVPKNKARVLDQCVRELLLAQSSDWPFIITQGTSAQYAERRVKDHVARFHYLAGRIDSGQLDDDYLAALEHVDNIFPDADYRLFA